MADFHRTSKSFFFIFFLASIPTESVAGKIYKVGDLSAWGIPSSSNPQAYAKWTKFHTIKTGDSLFFLYPPSQDSVVQVREESYHSCDRTAAPILFMNNGNSLFNITKPGEFYFISGADGHCEKSQKLHISVYGNGSVSADSPETAAAAPSYPTVFGSIPVQAAASDSPLLKIPLSMSIVLVFISLLAGVKM